MTGLKLHQGKSRMEIRGEFLHRKGGLALDHHPSGGSKAVWLLGTGVSGVLGRAGGTAELEDHKGFSNQNEEH